jgi:hypothetical protein
MKEVATGNATPSQLKVFQRHIDELTAIIQKQKRDEEEPSTVDKPQPSMVQYDGAADIKPPPAARLPQIQPQQQTQQQMPIAAQSTASYGQQQPWTAPVPTPAPPAHVPVIIQFKDAGATEDRFLFPQHSILESLSPQHLLASFIITRRGRDAVDSTGLDPDKEYWQPVTVMIEVAYGREELLKCIRRWVKSPEDVRKQMEDIMKRCQRAPDAFIALRLPFKASSSIEVEETSHDAATPGAEEKARHKSISKAAKKAASNDAKSAKDAVKKQADRPTSVPPTQPDTPSQSVPATELASTSAPETIDVAPSPEGNRPKRATRKSVRISED